MKNRLIGIGFLAITALMGYFVFDFSIETIGKAGIAMATLIGGMKLYQLKKQKNNS